MSEEQVSRLAAAVRQRYVPDSPTHDRFHLARVAALAERICVAEGGNTLVALAAAWLHDLHRQARPPGAAWFVSPEEMDDQARRYLTEAGIAEALHGPILAAIHYTDRFSFSDRGTTDLAPPEARAVRDADNLDAIGAIGVARAFSFGGSHDIPLYNSEAPPPNGTYTQAERPASTLHHFHEKLLKLHTELETKTALRIAERRHAYLDQFVREFLREWDEDFAAPGDAGAE